MCWRFSKRWILLEKKKKKKMEEALFCSLLLDGGLGVFVGLSGTEGAQFPSLFLGSVTGALVRDPYECLAQGRCRRGQCCGWRGRAMQGHSPEAAAGQCSATARPRGRGEPGGAAQEKRNQIPGKAVLPLPQRPMLLTGFLMDVLFSSLEVCS